VWKKLSFRKQIILILLIPITGLLYFTISNLSLTYKKYLRLEHSLENLEAIANLAKIKTLVNDERALYEYSEINTNHVQEHKKKLDQLKWRLSNSSSKDTIIKKNMQFANEIFNEISSKRTKKSTSLLDIYKNYYSINSILDNLIEREIINCDDTELAKLANNLKCYIGSKVSSNLIR
jgi:hypothetical protein